MIRDMVENNRSCRGYERRPVPMETLLELADCARLCSCGGNRQALRYALSCTEEKNALIFRHTRWGAALKERHLPDPGKEPAAYIVICLDHRLAPEMTPTLGVDVGIAAQTLCLAGYEKGLSSCMLMAFDRSGVKKDLGLEDEPVLVAAFGYRAEKAVLEQWKEGMPAYWRDENDVHHVPKRSLDECLL